MNLKTPLARYTIGMTVWMLLYAVCLIASITFIRQYHPEGIVLYAVAILPSLPIGGTIHVVMRYMKEADEYIRGLMSHRFILATGMVLFICTFWGFAENFAQAPQIPLYLVYPMFWASFALICPFVRHAK
ncbi:hypothetical protein [Asticcacaulis tiandongensis]|uniref:hypothetical protein n=1 Tax=Asticcacaulis tiandongensis TaxID=2565365 RepID=UPI00112ABEE1|nr:hypothetical protein [Asticcacaulis tiandongensis]